MTYIKPHASFSYVTPDDIANCWDEANADICAILVKGMKAYAAMTANHHKENDWCPASWIGEFNMSHSGIWEAFTDDEKKHLNAMAERHKVAHDAWMESILSPYEN